LEQQSESATEKYTARCTRSADVPRVVLRDSAGSLLESGTAPNATSKSHQALTTLTSASCAARVVISAKSRRMAEAICNALAPDLPVLSARGERATISLDGARVLIEFQSKDVSSLRASVNSLLLLAGASARCLTL
jgi:tRNA threonylcarbamoyladenosine modification (KEOPS) complex  Pcc1 subunit